MDAIEVLADYLNGPNIIRDAVAGMTIEQFHARPVVGKWSTHEVVCHLADTEMLYADRIKRVLAEKEPTLFGMDPDVHVPRLGCPERDIENELRLIELVRAQMSHILRSLKSADYQRLGHHTEAGPLTLQTLLERVTNHIPHHVRFIQEKRAALGI
jgi:hypothetical protein